MDVLTGSSQNFFVLIASFAFALFAAARAVESIRDFHEFPEDIRHLNSMSLMAIALMAAALAPLVLCDVEQDIQICSYFTFFVSSTLFVHFIWEFATKKILIFYPKFSLVLICAGCASILLFLLNAIWLQSSMVYRLLLLLAFLILCFRYYLVLGHFVSHSSKSRPKSRTNKPNNQSGGTSAS